MSKLFLFFFSLLCVLFFSFSNCSRIIQRSHTHFIQYVFSSFSRSLLCGFFFFSSILYSVSVSVFSFSFSFTVHLHRTDHLSWYVWVCVSMCMRVYRLYICVYCFLNWSTQTKICNKRQIFLSFICSFFPPKKKRLVLWEIFDWFQFEIGAFCTQSETICQWILTRCNFVYNRCFTISAWHKCLRFDFSIEFIIKSKLFTQLTWIILNYLNFWTFNFAKFQARNSKSFYLNVLDISTQECLDIFIPICWSPVLPMSKLTYIQWFFSVFVFNEMFLFFVFQSHTI